MNEKSLTPVIGKLEKLFSSLNTQFFNGELQRPVITVAPGYHEGGLWLVYRVEGLDG